MGPELFASCMFVDHLVMLMFAGPDFALWIACEMWTVNKSQDLVRGIPADVQNFI